MNSGNPSVDNDLATPPSRSRSLWQRLDSLAKTRANARAGLVADAVASVALLGAGLWTGMQRPVLAATTVVVGLIVFTFIEYGFHRWVFHGAANGVEEGHRRHHEDPAGYDALPFFVPPLGAFAIAALLALLLPVSASLLLTGALTAGYASYGIGHTMIHSVRFRRPRFVKWAANHHIHHHHPDRNFGVTTPIWDYIFGTRYLRGAQQDER